MSIFNRDRPALRPEIYIMIAAVSLALLSLVSISAVMVFGSTQSSAEIGSPSTGQVSAAEFDSSQNDGGSASETMGLSGETSTSARSSSSRSSSGSGGSDNPPSTTGNNTSNPPGPHINSSSSSYYSLSPSNSYSPVFMQIHHGQEGDWVPDFSRTATIAVNRSGRWSDIFSDANLRESDVVLIPAGINVVYDVSERDMIKSVIVKGSLEFDPQEDTKMVVETIALYGNATFRMKPRSDREAEVYFKGSINRNLDPAQMGLGLVAVCDAHCEVDIRGSGFGMPFVKVNGAQGSSQITTSSPTGWKAGDEIILVGTQTPSTGADPSSHHYNSGNRQFPQQTERTRIKSISGTRIELEEPLDFTHVGYGAILSRNVVFATDEDSAQRAHIMLTGHAEVTVENAAMLDMGRTTTGTADDTRFASNGLPTHIGSNQRGRYPLHVHHVHEPLVFEGNAISGSPRWGIINHNSMGEIRDNVVVGAEGAGIVGEDGLEVGVVQNNIVIGTGKGSGKIDDDTFGLSNGKDLGHGGFGYWFRGPFMEIEDNVAAGYFKVSGYGFFLHPSFTRAALPDIDAVPADLERLNGPGMNSLHPLRKFDSNVADGSFGLAGFSMEYSTPAHSISNFTYLARGNSSAFGVSLQHVNEMVIRNSQLSGARGTEKDSRPVFAHRVNRVSSVGSSVDGFFFSQI